MSGELAPAVRCALCRQHNPPVARWPLGPVCSSCYRTSRTRPGTCRRCQDLRVLVAGEIQGGPQPTGTMCGVCAGSAYTYLCPRCGGGEEPYRRGECVRCAVRDELQKAFSDGGGHVPAGLVRVVQALADSRRPRSVLKWLRNPRGGAAALRHLVASGMPLDHAALDELDPRHVWALRQVLVQHEVLPARHEELAKVGVHLHRRAQGLPAGTRQAVLTYGSWRVLRRAQRQLERTGRFTESSRRSAQRRIDACVQLLTWVDSRGLELATMSQPDLDRWLDAGHDRRAIADFLRWARGRRLVPALQVEHPSSRGRTVFMSDDDRWDLLSTCLHQPGIPDDVRAVGALLLLYGIHLTRILELTTDHLQQERRREPAGGPANEPVSGGASPGAATGLRVNLTSPFIDLPPPLGVILARLPVTSSPVSPLVQLPPVSPWLFSGRIPGRPMTAGGMARRLAAAGISVRASRNTALITLAADLPVKVLSDLLGINIATSVLWARQAARDWNGYVAALPQHAIAVPARQRESGEGKG